MKIVRPCEQERWSSKVGLSRSRVGKVVAWWVESCRWTWTRDRPGSRTDSLIKLGAACSDINPSITIKFHSATEHMPIQKVNL